VPKAREPCRRVGRESPGHGHEQGRDHWARPGRRARGMGWAVAGGAAGEGLAAGTGSPGQRRARAGRCSPGGGRAGREGARQGRGLARRGGGLAGRGEAAGAGPRWGARRGSGLSRGGARWGRGARAELGHTVDPNPRHARPLNGIRSQTEIRNRTRRTRD
jgi:hypothetical protein